MTHLPVKTYIDHRTGSSLNLAEIYRFRTLAVNFALRDFTIRYKQTWVGLAWGIIKPLMNVVIFGLISQFIDRTQNPVQSFINVSSGVIIWQLIATGMADVSNSLVANSGIMTKVYFPRIILSISALFVTLIDFTISFVIFFCVFIFFGHPVWQMVFFPFFVLMAVVLCLGAGIFFATLNVKFRDVNFILPFLLQLGFYVSPVFLKTPFVLSLNIPSFIKTVFLLNPATSIIDGFRWCIMGDPISYPMGYFLASVGISIAFLIFGVRYFLKFEKTFADYI